MNEDTQIKFNYLIKINNFSCRIGIKISQFKLKNNCLRSKWTKTTYINWFKDMLGINNVWK